MANNGGIFIAAVLLGFGFVLYKRNNANPGTFNANAPDSFNQYTSGIIPMAISSTGVQFIKSQEAYSPTPYPDADGQMRWGYGTPASGQHISKLDAENELVNWLALNVEPYIADNVTVPLDQNQYDALCSFIFNVGGPSFANSTLLADLNNGDYASAADQFSQWVHSAGAVSSVLTQRRAAEQGLFSS